MADTKKETVTTVGTVVAVCRNAEPGLPNLRQVCLVDASVFLYLAEQGIHIGPSMMGENITVTVFALMHLPPGTRLTIGSAEVELTEVRNPCLQRNQHRETQNFHL